MIRRPPRSTHCISSAASDVYKRQVCPLCESGFPLEFHQDARRTYLRCRCCRLVFVPQEFHLSPGDEKAEYDLHENSPLDEGYRQFLSRLFKPLTDKLKQGSTGLDFGCGPGPTLSVMFEEAGHRVAIYDPFYQPDRAPLEQTYDFVSASEVVEHFRNPRVDLNRMWDCVRTCLLYTSPSPRDATLSRMPSSA